MAAGIGPRNQVDYIVRLEPGAMKWCNRIALAAAVVVTLLAYFIEVKP